MKKMPGAMHPGPAAPAAAAQAHRWGVYEKALPAELDWPDRLAAAARAGFDFVEISIDESDERVGRLDWSPGRRRELRRALADAPASIDTMCLSAHRKFALGSLSVSLRRQALDIMRKAIDFSAELGIRIVQVAGYDVHYEPSTERTRALYMESILQSAAWARQGCVMLALENVENPIADSVEKGMGFVRAANTPWFQMYPDVGNLTAMQKDVARELRAGAGHLVGVHLKDTRVGEYRRVPFGTGLVDFTAAFRVLNELDFRGPFMVEMWNEAVGDPVAVVTEARRWLLEKLAEAG
ncbi:MAG TPA: L-ribulose-5-phosphate 3-epimerase [Spirochaetia bacterium]|nr:L-ribulose-5-phosphate 3-epimerase [Spirochaetia bacterium]